MSDVASVSMDVTAAAVVATEAKLAAGEAEMLDIMKEVNTNRDEMDRKTLRNLERRLAEEGYAAAQEQEQKKEEEVEEEEEEDDPLTTELAENERKAVAELKKYTSRAGGGGSGHKLTIEACLDVATAFVAAIKTVRTQDLGVDDGALLQHLSVGGVETSSEKEAAFAADEKKITNALSAAYQRECKKLLPQFKSEKSFAEFVKFKGGVDDETLMSLFAEYLLPRD